MVETSLALQQKVLLVTLSLARLLHAERHHGVGSCLRPVDRMPLLVLERTHAKPVLSNYECIAMPSLHRPMSRYKGDGRNNREVVEIVLSPENY